MVPPAKPMIKSLPPNLYILLIDQKLHRQLDHRLRLHLLPFVRSFTRSLKLTFSFSNILSTSSAPQVFTISNFSSDVPVAITLPHITCQAEQLPFQLHQKHHAPTEFYLFEAGLFSIKPT